MARHTSILKPAPLIGGVWLLVVSGCGSTQREHVSLPPSTTPETLAADAQEPRVISLTPPSRVEPPRATAPVSDASAIDDETAPAIVAASAPAAPEVAESADAPDRPVERVRVDAMVGQINGRPLFASDFFSTMDARLRAEAQRLSPEEWLRFARGEIRQALRDRIRDELLLSEVESSLTPEQRAGVVNFVRSLRENLISESRGSEEFAQRRLIEEQGITLEEAVRAKRDEELIRSWLRRILQNKVHVPWRDIRQRYERDRSDYNPPSSAVFRVIRVRASSDVAVEGVTAALAQNEPFDAVAQQYSNYETDNDNLFDTALTASTYAESTFFGPRELNEAARALSPGEFAGPIEVGSSLYWIKLEEIRDISQSLYDVQIEIQQQIFSERVREAENDYFQTLLERSGLGGANREIERMEIRLFEIAAERYLLSRVN